MSSNSNETPYEVNRIPEHLNAKNINGVLFDPDEVNKSIQKITDFLSENKGCITYPCVIYLEETLEDEDLIEICDRLKEAFYGSRYKRNLSIDGISCIILTGKIKKS